MAFETLGPEQARELGKLALAASTPPEERSVAWFARELGATRWPAVLRVSAVDAESGELRIFDAASGVPLERAVAASCCVPGIFAPVSIEGRRYIDGGVRSGTHADLALASGARHVLVMTPMVRGNAGRGFLRVSSKSPSAARRFLSCSKANCSAPRPLGSRYSRTT